MPSSNETPISLIDKRERDELVTQIKTLESLTTILLIQQERLSRPMKRT